MTKEEALNEIRSWAIPSKKGREVLETLIPELAESEDEMVRQWLLDYAIEMIAGLESDISRSTYDGIKGHDPEAEAELAQWRKARAYLERQKDLAAIPDELVKNYKLFCENGRREVAVLINAINGINEQKEQEPTPDTDVLHTELVNLLKTYRIGEETARTMADRIADTYGAQKYMDGLCDGLDEEDTKQEQPEVELEKEIDNYSDTIQAWQIQEAPFTAIEKCARHFYELGLNAKKED